MFDVTQAFTIEVDGGDGIALTPSDHVASGGEGHVFRRGALAIKIWDDPGRARQDGMAEKIRRLQALLHGGIVAPQALARDRAGAAIGFVMPWAEQAWALPLAFTNDWRDANGFDDDAALRFIAAMREVVQFAHAAGAVLGDANECNILGRAGAPLYIDVDSWALPGFPGGKTMPSIADPHAAAFSREADWFAWGIVSFQLLIGLHPYRGTHPDFKRNDLAGRMRAKASVLEPAVRVSAAARSFAVIPDGLHDWYQAVFESGLRAPPPDPLAKAARSVAMASGLPGPRDQRLRTTELHRLPARLLAMATPDVMLLRDGRLVALADGRPIGQGDPRAVFAAMPGGMLVAARVVGTTIFTSIVAPGAGPMAEMRDTGMAAQGVWAVENRLFALVSDGLLELQPRAIGDRHVLLPGRRWALRPDTCFLGAGIGVFAILGAAFLVLPFGPQAVAMLRATELDGFMAVSAVRRGQVAVIALLGRDGGYRRAEFVFAADYAFYAVTLGDAQDGSLSDAVTPAGLVVRLAGDGRLELSDPARGGRATAEPGEVAGGRLIGGTDGVFCVVERRVYRLGMAA
jgi:transposase-like protein